MKGVIVPETMEESAIKELFDTPLETQLVKKVSTRDIKHMGDGRYHVPSWITAPRAISFVNWSITTAA